MRRETPTRALVYLLAMGLAELLQGADISCGGRTPLDAADAVATSDVEAGQPGCDPQAPFTSVDAVAGDIDTPADDSDIRLTPDELTAYFVSSRAREGGYGADVFVTRRATRADAFLDTSIVVGLASPNSTAQDPNVTPDQLNAVFEGACVGVLDHVPTLCGARRSSTSEPFESPFVINVGDQPTPKFGGGSYLLPDGAVVYFQGSNFAGHPSGLGRATRAAVTDDFGPIGYVDVGAPDAGVIDGSPVVTEDELAIYFARSSPPSTVGAIWVATRATVSTAFASAHPIAELASTLDAAPNWISADGCRLYFTREVSTGDGGVQRDIFVASR